MGYTTDFEGRFNLDRPLTHEHAAYLQQFAETRRMTRDPSKTIKRPDPIRVAAGLLLGPDAAYFVGEGGMCGQDRGPDIVADAPGGGQPGLWCQWVPTEDRTSIEWDQNEKFYCYEEWIRYIVKHFLEPWGYVLNGVVDWQGEEDSDTGKLYALDNYIGSNLSALQLLARQAE